MRFEFSTNVVLYREQPIRLYYNFNGKLRRYTPDFEVTLETGEIVYIEVKPYVKASTQEEQERFSAIANHLSTQGIRFLVLTEGQIRHAALIPNIARVLPNLDIPLDAMSSRRLIGTLPLPITFDRAAEILGCRKTVWTLLAKRILHCDYTQDISGESMLMLYAEGACNENIHI